MVNNPLAAIDSLGLAPVYDPSSDCWDDWNDKTNTLTGRLPTLPEPSEPSDGGAGLNGPTLPSFPPTLFLAAKYANFFNSQYPAAQPVGTRIM